MGVGRLVGVGLVSVGGLSPEGVGFGLGSLAVGLEGTDGAGGVLLSLGDGESAVTERGDPWRAAVRTAAFGRWPHLAGADAAEAGLMGRPAANKPMTPADSTVVPASAPRPAPRRVVHTISASSRSASRQGFHGYFP